jgi:hypothetical protein
MGVGTQWLVQGLFGEAAEAIERFQIARAIAPGDPLNFLCCVGIAAGHLWAARYDESARWFECALAEKSGCSLDQHNLIPAYALVGRKEHARRCLTELSRVFPDLTIARVRSGLPFGTSFLDRVAETKSPIL